MGLGRPWGTHTPQRFYSWPSSISPGPSRPLEGLLPVRPLVQKGSRRVYLGFSSCNSPERLQSGSSFLQLGWREHGPDHAAVREAGGGIVLRKEFRRSGRQRAVGDDCAVQSTELPCGEARGPAWHVLPPLRAAPRPGSGPDTARPGDRGAAACPAPGSSCGGLTPASILGPDARGSRVGLFSFSY